VRLLHLRCTVGRLDLFSARSAYLPVLAPIFCAGLWISHEGWSRSPPESLLRFFLWFAHPRAPTVDPFCPDSLFRPWIEDHTENYPKTQAN
jgi:hypothetical protein